MRTTAFRHGARAVPRDGARPSQLIPRPRRALSWEQVADRLREGGVEVTPDLPASSTAPYEVRRSSGSGVVQAVALAGWLDDEERLVVLQTVRGQLLADR